MVEELGQEALDDYFDMRQGKAESIQDYAFREEILTVALREDRTIDLDEKIRGYWLVRTSRTSRNERFLESRSSLRGRRSSRRSKKTITQTIVAKRREEVRDDLREAGGQSARPSLWIC